MLYSESSKGFGVRHILVYAGNPYDVMDRPDWFAESLFSQIATLCQQNEIEVTLTNAGGSPCTRALELRARPRQRRPRRPTGDAA